MMTSELKAKLIVIAVAIVGSAYLLMPTLLGLEAKREALADAGQEEPGYFALLPQGELKLGLDLAGGIALELAVEHEEAVRRKTDVIGNEIGRILGEDGNAPSKTTQLALGKLIMEFDSAASAKALEGLIADRYRGMLFFRDSDASEHARFVEFSQEYHERLRNDIIDQATQSVRNRINRYGVGEPDIRQQGDDRIAIELPGLKNPERALELIKQTGQLEFRMVHGEGSPEENGALALQVVQARESLGLAEDDYTVESTKLINDALAADLPEGTELFFELVRDSITGKVLRGSPHLLTDKAQITGDMLDNAYVTQYQNEPQVAFDMNAQGTKIFADLTSQNVGRFFAIVLDGTVMSAPRVNEPIRTGSGVITLGAGTYEEKQREAKDLTLILQEGALPATLNEVDGRKSFIGPSLGAELIRSGFQATAIAAMCVLIFMLIYYKGAGLLADAAVVLNIGFLLALLTLFEARLTMPGIAGIVLTIGMAVDANVIINERIREELRNGKAVRAAVSAGYANAQRAILDANITTLIAGVVLYQFGSDAIKGFAVTLCAGIITTLFTAVVCTKAVYEYLFISRKMEKLSI